MKNRSSEEFNFLRGPRSRWSEFVHVVKVAEQFIRGFRKLHFVGPCVTVFGSARFKEDHPYYIATREISAEIAKLGFTIMTGGGPGVMEAANRGAKDVNGKSVGCSIILPNEQAGNPYLDVEVVFKHFFVRKVLLLKYSFAFVVMPGGAGTLDELFETFTLIQTGKIKGFPIVLYGTDYWSNVTKHIDKMIEEGTISPGDKELVFVTDSVSEAVEYVREKLLSDFAKKPMRLKPSSLLAEA